MDTFNLGNEVQDHSPPSKQTNVQSAQLLTIQYGRTFFTFSLIAPAFVKISQFSDKLLKNFCNEFCRGTIFSLAK